MKWRFNKRIFQCLWRDKVDLGVWLVTIFFFIYSWFSHDVGKVLWVLIFYIYHVMYRMNHYWQDRQKMYMRLKELGEDVDAIIKQKDL